MWAGGVLYSKWAERCGMSRSAVSDVGYLDDKIIREWI